ncbi:MAG: hypothetical protein LBN31_04010 [Hungatella sp.]|nr:hypothetical protein [Hungatella sp.]
MDSLDNYRRIYIDLPGFGSSKVNPSIKNADDMLAFLTNFIKEVSEKEEFQDFIDYAVIAATKTWVRYKNEIMPGQKDADINFTNTYQKEGYGFSFEASLKDINFDKPIAVITGKQDNCVGYEDAWRLVKHLPRLTFV